MIETKRGNRSRGTFATRLIQAGLTNAEIANVLVWSADNVETVRRICVDDAAVVVALSERVDRWL